MANLNRFIIIVTAAGGVQAFHLIYHIIWSQAEDLLQDAMLGYLFTPHSVVMHVFRPEVDDFQSVFRAELSVFPPSHQMALTWIHYPYNHHLHVGIQSVRAIGTFITFSPRSCGHTAPKRNYIRLACKYLGAFYSLYFQMTKKEKTPDTPHTECYERLLRVNFLLRFHTELPE